MEHQQSHHHDIVALLVRAGAGINPRSGSTFASEEEFEELAGTWPMKRFVEIWSRLPGVQPVQKFENRKHVRNLQLVDLQPV